MSWIKILIHLVSYRNHIVSVEMPTSMIAAMTYQSHPSNSKSLWNNYKYGRPIWIYNFEWEKKKNREKEEKKNGFRLFMHSSSLIRWFLYDCRAMTAAVWIWILYIHVYTNTFRYYPSGFMINSTYPFSHCCCLFILSEFFENDF